jgi:hypothetical protein
LENLLVRCTICQESKPRQEYYDSKKHLTGRMSWCKECHRDRNSKYYRSTSEAKRKADRLRKYGLTQEKFDELLLKQDGKCAICEVELDFGRDSYSLTIDHDHTCCPPTQYTTCGKCIRGILCRKCNVMLGYYEALRGDSRFERYLGITEV